MIAMSTTLGEPEVKGVGVKDTAVLPEGFQPITGHASLPA
jgi:hypothetical protein